MSKYRYKHCASKLLLSCAFTYMSVLIGINGHSFIQVERDPSIRTHKSLMDKLVFDVSNNDTRSAAVGACVKDFLKILETSFSALYIVLRLLGTGNTL